MLNKVKKSPSIFLLFVVLFSGCGSLEDLSANYSKVQIESLKAVIHPPEHSDCYTKYEPNSYIVMFRTIPSQARLNFSSFGAEYRYHFMDLTNRFWSDPRILNMQFISSVDLAISGGQELRSELGLPKHLRLAMTPTLGKVQRSPVVGVMARIDFKDRDSSKAVLSEWEKNKILWYAEPNWISELSQTPSSETTTSNIFGKYAEEYALDPSWHWLAGMQIIDGLKYLSDEIVAGRLSESELIANAPVIAVMDSGVDFENEHLKGRMWENPSVGQADCPGDVHGCDTTRNTKGQLGDGNTIYPFATEGAGEACPSSTEGGSNGTTIAGNCHHGTHVAGIAAGCVDSGTGVPGICPICKIMVVKVVAESEGAPGGGIPDSAILSGLRYITRFIHNGRNIVRIVNASLGKFQRSRFVALLVARLRENGLGTLVIGAAGNEDTNTRAYPAALSQALAVSSVDGQGAKASYSNYGPWVDIAAPGGYGNDYQIGSADPGMTTLHYSQGTSMAAPMVSGVAGLILATNPNLTAERLKQILITTADSSIYNNETNDQYYYPQTFEARVPLLGSGTVNLFNALTNKQDGVVIENFLNSRVTEGCSAIALINKGIKNEISDKSHFYFFLMLLFFLPPFWVLIRRKQP
ncbi:MAG: S8 family serine peptidase [Bdellovibrionota bacterium]